MRVKLKVLIYDKPFRDLCEIMRESKRGDILEKDIYYWDMSVKGVG